MARRAKICPRNIEQQTTQCSGLNTLRGACDIKLDAAVCHQVCIRWSCTMYIALTLPRVAPSRFTRLANPEYQVCRVMSAQSVKMYVLLSLFTDPLGRNSADLLTLQALKEFATKETSRKRPARLTFYDAKGGAGVSIRSISKSSFKSIGTRTDSQTVQGSGISTKAFEFIDILLMRACDRVAACHCQVIIP